jgi:hypothetical protein
MTNLTNALIIGTDDLEDTEVATLRRVINETLASFSAGDIDPAAVYGWTRQTAAELHKRLIAGNRPVQAKVIELEVGGGGVCQREAVYTAGGYAEDRSLNGFTKPVGRIMRQMQAEGLLPHDAVDPMRPIYDASNPSFQKAQGFRMPADLVAVFAQGLKL